MRNAARELADLILSMDMVTENGITARNLARKVLDADALPMKTHPEFLAGYSAGSQPARVPLTIKQIEACMKRAYAAAAGSRNLDICFAREIEADHGITTQPASVPFLPGEYETLTERGAVAWAGYDAKDDLK